MTVPADVPAGHDPLIPTDFAGWFTAITETLRRSGRRMAAVTALWGVVPTIGGAYSTYLTTGVLAEVERTLPENPTGRASAADLELVLSALGTFAGVFAALVGVSLLLGYFTLAGIASAMRIAVYDAHGRDLALTDALRFGARRGLRMWGWYLLVSLCVMVGLCLCVLPGMYLAVVFALFVPVAVFEGGGQVLARSLRLVHRSFGAMLGRILLVGAVCVAVSLLGAQLLAMTGLAVMSPQDVTVVSVGAEAVVTWVVGVATGMVLAAGLLVTYAETRAGDRDLVTSEQLI
ncbi:hypothetical protein [Stackebrandtia albiflava]|nr:hypothetical protein [Stackebrandtia albiflava]